MRNLLLLLFLANITLLNAQNWQVVTSFHKYHYSCDTTQTIFTIRTDSTSVQNNDTIFYLNRIILNCDTCQNLEQAYPGYYFYLKNQPQFLMRSCKLNADTQYFYNPNSFVLFPKKNIGYTWVYDTLNNISATINSKVTSNVLGQMDSTCIILLNSGDSIIVSKNFGITKFPLPNQLGYYRLIGNEVGTQLFGKHIALFKDFFNLNVGDEFNYEITFIYPESPPDHTKRWHYQILGKTEYPFGYEYNISGFYCIEYWACVDTTNFSGVLSFREDTNPAQPLNYGFYHYQNNIGALYNAYSLEAFKISDYPIYMRLKKSLQNNATVINTYTTELSPFFQLYPQINHDVLYCTYPENSADHDFIFAVENMGIQSQDYLNFETVYRMNTLLYIHAGDTIIFVGDKSISNNAEVKIYPNPSINEISILNQEKYNKAEIYSVSGVKKDEFKLFINDINTYPLNDYKAGIYIIKLSGENNSKWFKLIIL